MGAIHPTATIDPRAEVDPTARIGPYAVIDGEARIGPGCVIGPHVHVTGRARIGPGNRFHAGCVIGDAPQDLKYHGEPTELIIGRDNIFREHVTVHRSNNPEEPTRIGDGNFFMAHSHVGHNCRVDNGAVLANGALLGGHVTVEDRAFISGNCLVHQFVRVGQLAIMQGGSAVSLDLPPFTVARGDNSISGLNTIGLRRAGVAPEKRLELRELYHILFLRGLPLSEALAQAKAKPLSRWGKALVEFLENSRRGFCRPRKR